MKQSVLCIFTRTPLHVGAGSSVGAIDQPVQRERHTGFPIIPGSSIKGVLADLWFDADNMKKIKRGDNEIWVRKEASEIAWLFGKGDEENKGEDGKANASSGCLVVGEARILAFPMRSARGGFAWTTCPLALSRFKRDAGLNTEIPAIQNEDCFAENDMAIDGKVVLEEYCLAVKDQSSTAALLKNVVDDEVWKSVAQRFIVVSDEMFTCFVRNACEVVTRVRIDDETGTVAKGALFNQENVPSETLFYAAINAQPLRGGIDGDKTAGAAMEALAKKIAAHNNLLQIGGDGTIGLGYCSVKLNGGD